MTPESKGNVLIVNDRPKQLLALEPVLSDLRQNIVIAHSGKETLSQVAATEFAVILLDIRMPDIDGFETATRVRQNQSSEQTPIILLLPTAKVMLTC